MSRNDGRSVMVQKVYVISYRTSGDREVGGGVKPQNREVIYFKRRINSVKKKPTVIFIFRTIPSTFFPASATELNRIYCLNRSNQWRFLRDTVEHFYRSFLAFRAIAAGPTLVSRSTMTWSLSHNVIIWCHKHVAWSPVPWKMSKFFSWPIVARG